MLPAEIFHVPRTLEEVSTAANTDPIFAGKCYRLLVQNLDLQLPVIDSNKYLAKIANKAKVSEKTYRSCTRNAIGDQERPCFARQGS